MSREMTEARSLLRDAAMERLRAPARANNKATEVLFAQLSELAKASTAYGLRLQEQDGWNELAYGIGGHRGSVRHLTDHGIRVVGKKHIAVELDVDPASNTLVGREPDRFQTPIPGESIPRRSALAVLVEAMLAALKE